MTPHPISKCLQYNDIFEGQIDSFDRTLSWEDMITFAKLSGNYNPLHYDKKYGEQSSYKKCIVHGMLAAALFSELLGMHCPGEKGICLNQTLNFHEPIFPGDTVRVVGTVLGKSDATHVISIRTEIFNQAVLAISGEAKVRV